MAHAGLTWRKADGFLRADARAYLIYILGGGVAVVIACDGTRDTNVFGGFDNKNLVAEGVQTGFI